MKLALGFLVFLGMLSVATPAKADILLEPYVKYEVSGGPTYSGISYSQTGPGFGARLGIQELLLFGALDYSMTSGTLSGGSSPSFSESQLFAVVGVRLPLFRAYAGYGFIDNLDMKFSSEATLEGSAAKLGLSFTGIPIIAINLEYVANTYTKVKNSAGTESSLSSNVTGNSVVLSVSAPFAF